MALRGSIVQGLSSNGGHVFHYRSLRHSGQLNLRHRLWNNRSSNKVRVESRDELDFHCGRRTMLNFSRREFPDSYACYWETEEQQLDSYSSCYSPSRPSHLL